MNLIRCILFNSFIYGLPVKETIKVCVNCKYFVLRKLYDNYDNSVVGQRSDCSKFVTKNIVSGERKEESALTCRSNEQMCGMDTKHFTSKHSTTQPLETSIFINHDTNTCVDCQFGVPHIPTDPWEERDPIEYHYRCQKFATTNVVSGKEETKLAKVCRSNEKLCGIHGTFFIKK